MISAQTGLLGVIGWPVAHSRSPAMHNAALRALGLDLVYLALPVSPDRLAAAIEGAAALGFRGLNVTVPHKAAVLALCRPDALALEVGAVNTLSFEAGSAPLGSNTDVYGVQRLVEESGASARGPVVVLGAGGAARAVVAALAPRAASLRLFSRTPGAMIVADRRYTVEPLGSPALDQALSTAELLIDATPRGLDPGAPPTDLSALPPSATVLDLVVAAETPLTRSARARGLRTATGDAMLVHQGARALERWTGRAAPIEVMRRALEDRGRPPGAPPP